ncbi:MAG: hypothetical protein PHV68_03005 [Candidatus Gastranaerophilales bacterium]|nr:hypothetical protein [Candidatus Gastranaerophilales bacterium]
MSIYTKLNILNKPLAKKVISQFSNPNAIASVAFLEGTVIVGRCKQAKKRGGELEFKTRFAEETLTAAVWLGGIKAINTVADSFLKRMPDLKEITTDIGRDFVRDPVESLMKKKLKNLKKANDHTTYEMSKIIKETRMKLTGTKFAKVAFSAAVGIYLAGSVIPKFKNKLIAQEKAKQTKLKQNVYASNLKGTSYTGKLTEDVGFVSMENFLDKSNLQKNKVSFGNSVNAVNLFKMTGHNLEHNPIARILTVDVGVTGGRAKNSLNKSEKIEILFRDISSIFFYMFSTPLIAKGLSKLDEYKGKNTNLDPEVADLYTKRAVRIITNLGQNPTKESAKKAISNVKYSELLKQFGDRPQKEELINVKDFVKEILEKDASLKKDDKKYIVRKTLEFAKHNPVAKDGRFITSSQIPDILSEGFIHEADFVEKAMGISSKVQDKDMIKMLNEGILDTLNVSKLGDNGIRKITKFVKQKELEEIRKNIKDYTDVVFKKVDECAKFDKNSLTDVVQSLQNRNSLKKLAYVGTGLAVSAFFLSIVIPKTQCLITKLRTGKDEFPATMEE